MRISDWSSDVCSSDLPSTRFLQWVDTVALSVRRLEPSTDGRTAKASPRRNSRARRLVAFGPGLARQRMAVTPRDCGTGAILISYSGCKSVSRRTRLDSPVSGLDLMSKVIGKSLLNGAGQFTRPHLQHRSMTSHPSCIRDSDMR